MHDEIENYIYGESDKMQISHLTDYKNRPVSPSSILFFSNEDRQEFLDIYEKHTDSAMLELCETWDNQPSDMWTDEFIQFLSGDDSNDEQKACHERYLSGEIMYIYTKKNMALSNSMVTLINNILPKGSTILEFGSGRGTQKLSETFNMLSVEENTDWVDRYDSEYLHAEIKDDWYDVDKVNEFIKNKTYDAILIDGPAHGNRNKMIELISSGKLKIDTNVYVFVDDADRKDGKNLLKQILSNKEFHVEPMTGIIKQGNTPIDIRYFKPQGEYR